MIKRLLKMTIGGFAVLFLVVGCQMARNSGNETLPEATSETLRVATYNVHYIVLGQEAGPWSRGDWERRKGPLDLAFNKVNADVIAFQEMESFAGRSESSINLTLDWLLARNPNYAAAATGDVSEFPSTQPILYRRDRLAVLDQGWFFFSETPDVIYSRTFNGSYPAFASWAEFEDQQDGTIFRVINFHTDFRSRSNQQRSVELVSDRVKQWRDTGETVFVVGDLNARPGSSLLSILEDEGVVFAPVSGATYHFNKGLNLFDAIDHIGVAGAARLIGTPVVLRQKFGGEWPTDHYPVIADFVIEAAPRR